MEERVMDTIFYVYEGQKEYKTYLLTDWGREILTNIDAWVATLRIKVTKTHWTIIPTCEYDFDNLKWIGKAILNSVTIPFCETVEKDLGVDTYGLDNFSEVVYNLQQVSSAAVRTLMVELKNLFLLKTFGQDIEIFGGQVV